MNERATHGRAGRFLLVLLSAVAWVIAGAAPASAHTISGPRPTNYLTTLDSITPRIPGISVRVVDLGNKLELTNRTAADIVVLGYDAEPYLRIGPRGVYENLRSPATYLDRTRAGTATVPQIALRTGPSTPPSWNRVSSGHTAIWHDHRIHWMGASPPPAVQRDPGAFHTVKARWTVVFVYRGNPVTAAGRLVWVPGPSGWPWLPLIAALFAFGFFAAIRRRPATAIAIVATVVGLDLAHTVSAELARPGTQLAKTVQFFGDNFVSVFVWIAALVTVLALRRGRIEARYGVLLVGAMVALVSGLSDLSYLWKSQLPGVGPHLLARAEVVAELGLGFGLAGGALLALRRTVPRRARDAHDPRWLARLVGDLDDDALGIVCDRLVADEVIPLALADFAVRCTSAHAAFGSDALVFVVLARDEIGSHVWSVAAGARGLRVQRGTPAPVAAELRTTFPVFLQLLAGSRTIEQSVAAGRLDVSGDPDLLAAVAPAFAPDTEMTVPVATV